VECKALCLGRLRPTFRRNVFKCLRYCYALGQHILQTYHLGRFCVNPCDENVLKCVEV